jgi:hypothetical protein
MKPYFYLLFVSTLQQYPPRFLISDRSRGWGILGGFFLAKKKKKKKNLGKRKIMLKINLDLPPLFEKS